MNIFSFLSRKKQPTERKVAYLKDSQRYVFPVDTETADIRDTLVELEQPNPDDLYTIEVQKREGKSWHLAGGIKKEISTDPDSPWM